MFKRYQQIHLIGIGGSGMSGIAEILLSLGYRVTGSDVRRTDVVEGIEHHHHVNVTVGRPCLDIGNHEARVGDAQAQGKRPRPLDRGGAVIDADERAARMARRQRAGNFTRAASQIDGPRRAGD